MAKTAISDVIVPSVFEKYVIERTAKLSAFGASGIVESDPFFDALAAGGGNTVDMPFWQDVSPTRQILSDSAPLTVNKITASKDIARIQVDGNAWSVNDLAKVLSGDDPMGALVDRIRDFLHYTYAVPFPYPAPPAPGAPFDLGASPDGSDVYLWWDLSEARYATGVEIERKLTSAPDSSFAVIAVIGIDVEYYDPGIAPQSMTYRARAFNAGGYSGYSNTATVNF